MTPLEYNIQHKAYHTCASYGTYQEALHNSQIERVNTFPYPFYFMGNAFNDEPIIHPRRAGWSPQVLISRPPLIPDPYPNHCFQGPCNTRYTNEVPAVPPAPAAGARAKAPPPAPAAGPGKPSIPSPDDRCSTNRCIVLYR
jgi:hypothetical protein